MTDRIIIDMLSDLLCQANSKAIDAVLEEDISYAEQIEIEAEYLISHGLTFQRWIPVTERLPEEDGYYLVYKYSPYGGWCEVVSFARDGREVDDYDFAEQWENVWYDYDSEWGYITFNSVTHWMPLPEPPKDGERKD